MFSILNIVFGVVENMIEWKNDFLQSMENFTKEI